MLRYHNQINDEMECAAALYLTCGWRPLQVTRTVRTLSALLNETDDDHLRR